MFVLQQQVDTIRDSPWLFSLLLLITILSILLNTNVVVTTIKQQYRQHLLLRKTQSRNYLAADLSSTPAAAAIVESFMKQERLQDLQHLNSKAPDALAASLASADLLFAVAMCVLQTLDLNWDDIEISRKLEGSVIGDCNENNTLPDIREFYCYSPLLQYLEPVLTLIILSSSLVVVLHILLVTILKYLAVLKPLVYSGYLQRSTITCTRAVAVSSVVWILSYIATFTYFLPLENSSVELQQQVTIGFFSVIIALLIITFIVNIPIVIESNKKAVLGTTTGPNTNCLSAYLPRNRKAVIKFLLILTCTAVGQVPEIVVFMLKTNFFISDIKLFFTIAMFLKLLTALINPIIYSWGTFSFTYDSAMSLTVQKCFQRIGPTAKKITRRSNIETVSYTHLTLPTKA